MKSTGLLSRGINARSVSLGVIGSAILGCHFTGGTAAAIGVPAGVLLLLVILFARIPGIRKKKRPATPTEPILQRIARSSAEATVAEIQLSSLGSAYRKEQWDQAELAVDAIIDACISLIKAALKTHTVAVFFPTQGEGYALRRFNSESKAVDPAAVITPGLGVLGGLLKNSASTLAMSGECSATTSTRPRSISTSRAAIEVLTSVSMTPCARWQRRVPRRSTTPHPQ